MDGVLRGAGDVLVFTVANFINLTVRVSLAVILAPRYGVEFVWYAVPMGWAVNLVLSSIQYFRGKWKKVKQE